MKTASPSAPLTWTCAGRWSFGQITTRRPSTHSTVGLHGRIITQVLGNPDARNSHGNRGERKQGRCVNDERVGEPSLRAERSNPASTTVDLGRFAACAMTVMEDGERAMGVQPR